MTELKQRLQDALAGGYEIRRELGRGGMAVVYLAEDLRHGRPVAIKVFQPEVADSVGGERFVREIQVAARLSHPHILPLHDSGELDGLLYYIMPYVEGETLRDRIGRGQLALAEAIHIAREVADGLDYAHAQGLVHRDIKPENIMLTRGHAVIMDFGVSRAIGGGDADQALTRTGLTVGTPMYMSPEQWSTPERVDGRSDIYGLGCVLYEMLVGEPPFTGTSTQVLLARHMQQEVPALSIVRPDLPAGVDQVIRRALAKVPAERYAAAGELAAELTRFVTGSHPVLPVAADGTGVRGIASGTGGAIPLPAQRRTRRKAIIGGVATLVLAIVVAAYSVLAPDASAGASDRIRVVVLPFENIGPPEREYFADAITEEITSRLSSIGNLGVIARTSALQYRGTTRSIREITQELNVAWVVEGSLRCSCTPGDQLSPQDTLRVSARLISTSDGTQVWSEEYQVVAAEIFSLHGNIAQRVARALNVGAGAVEQRQLAATRGASLDAYDLYLRGNTYYSRSWQRTDVETALRMYEEALAVDPNFALAHAQASRTHSWIYRLGFDTTETRLVAAHNAARRALELDAELPEAYIALGLYEYWGRWDYDAAVDALHLALELQPGNANVHQNIGNIRRRQGRWQDAIAAYEAAADLDPRAHIIWYNLGETQNFVRNHAEAERHLARVNMLAPDFLEGYLERAAAALRASGDTIRARQLIREAINRVPPAQWRTLQGFWLAGTARIMFDSTPELRDQTRPGNFGLDSVTYLLFNAERAHRGGRVDEARTDYEKVVRILAPAASDGDSPDRWLHARLALAYAGLQRADEAVAAAERAVQLLAGDEFDRPDMVVVLASVHLRLGRLDAALDALDLALLLPSRISQHLVRLDPHWAPLRAHPRYAELMRRGQRIVAGTADGAGAMSAPGP